MTEHHPDTIAKRKPGRHSLGKTSSGGRTPATTVRLTEAQTQMALSLGDGNVSQGIREALNRALAALTEDDFIPF